MASQRLTGETPQMLLDRPRCPDGCESLWLAFKELHASRCSSGFGPMRITFTEIDAYGRVTGAQFKPWEVEAVRRADRAFMEDWQSRQKKPG
jgi:hypothetical protein